MIPILSESATLQGNGLGGLSDAIECVVTDEVNGEYELRMRYPVTGEHYGEIQNNLIIFAEPMALATAQPFRIYRITKPLNGVVTIYARHLAYDMSGIVVKPFSALSLTAALSAVPTYSVPACPFTLTSTRTITSKMEIDEPRPLWTLLGGSAGSFLDVYGGEWEFDGYTATLKTKLGEDRGVVIRYGKNLTELENDSDLSSTYGGVFPYWYDEEEGLVTITEGYVPVAGSVFTRILLLDCSSDFDEKPTEAQLRTKAQNYIDNNSVGSPKDSWKVSFAQLAQAGEYETQALLEEVQLGDTVSVIYEALGVNASARVVKTEWDVLGEKYKAVTIGRVKQNLASILVGQNKETERAISQTKSALERAIASSTDFIKNGTGVMRFIYSADGDLMEIVSLDNADLSQAQSVWRWNNGGFGHSSTGYNGTYTTAITQDGQIVADFITTGTLSGNRVRTGLIEDETGTNYWNLDTGEFHSQTLETAITQTAGEVSIVAGKLNNIGGRNIIRGTGRPVLGSGAWSNGTIRASGSTAGASLQIVDITDSPVAGITKAIKLTTSSTQPRPGFAQDAYSMQGHVGEKITYSAWVKGQAGDVVTLQAWWLNSSNASSREITLTSSNWTRINYVSNAITTDMPTVSIGYMYYASATAGTSLYIVGQKEEFGEVPTSWSPAPEDKVGNDEIISKINVSPENITISANKVDLQGYVTFSNLSTSGQTAINGANIITGTLNANAIAANSTFTQNLTATNFNLTGGSINVSAASASTNVITLQNGDHHSAMQPVGFVYYNGSTGDRYELNRYGFYSYKDVSANSYALGYWSGASIVLGATNSAIKQAGSVYINGSQNKIRLAALGSDGSIRSYNGDYSKYSAAIWPDGNGAGRLMLGDGTGATWRTSLTNNGLTFSDSSGNVTASYPATGLPKLSGPAGGYNSGFINTGDYRASALGVATNAPILDTVTALFKKLAADYPSLLYCKFCGTFENSGRHMFMAFIYETHAVSNGIPQYGSGMSIKYNGLSYIFWVDNYTVNVKRIQTV